MVAATGCADKSAWSAAVKALDSHDWSGFASSLGEPGAKAASSLVLKRCAHCQDHEPLMTYSVTFGLNTKKPQTAKKYQSMIRVDDLNQLETALKAKGAERAKPAEA